MKSNDSLTKTITKSSQGFSLIEILIALTLLGIAGTFVAGKIFDSLYEGQVKSAKIQMNSVAARLKDYRRKCGAYPTTDQGLEALISEASGGRKCRNYPPNGFIESEEVPVDPWDNEFVYESDGKTFTMKSLGNDGADGGEDQDADIPMKGKRK